MGTMEELLRTMTETRPELAHEGIDLTFRRIRTIRHLAGLNPNAPMPWSATPALLSSAPVLGVYRPEIPCPVCSTPPGEPIGILATQPGARRLPTDADRRPPYGTRGSETRRQSYGALSLPIIRARRAQRGESEALGLWETYWVHSEALGEKSGTARSLREMPAVLDEFLRATDPASDGSNRDLPEESAGAERLTVHTVEVCLHCQWNFVTREDSVWRVADPGGVPTRQD